MKDFSAAFQFRLVSMFSKHKNHSINSQFVYDQNFYGGGGGGAGVDGKRGSSERYLKWGGGGGGH